MINIRFDIKRQVFLIVSFFIFGCLLSQDKSINKAGRKSGNPRQEANWLKSKKIKVAFSLSKPATVSAGVYKGDSLVRTLFNNRKYQQGSFEEYFDPYSDNFDTILSASGLTVRVLTNNVSYKWDGVIGNTSKEKSGPTIHNGYLSFYYLQVYGSKVYYSQYYAEGPPSQHIFDINNIQQTRTLFPAEKEGTAQATTCLATDGNYVYWAGGDPFSQKRKKSNNDFVFATKVSDDTEASFENGHEYQCAIGRKYKSVIDNTTTPLGEISGIAVQTSGAFLFVARKNLNEIKVINKITGAIIKSNNILSPLTLAVDNSGQLWCITNNVARKFAVSKDGTLSEILSLKDLVKPLAIAVNPNNNEVAIADAGTSQQIKGFNNVTGKPAWTFGKPGGYYEDATVENDRFYFSGERTSEKFGVSMCYHSDGSLWLLDGGNYRVMHYDSNRKYIEHIQAIPNSYNCFVDPKDPGRVFSDYLEFHVDYTKPLLPFNGSWTFVKNWGATVPDLYDNKWITLRPMKFPNGHTYSFLNNETTGKYLVVELTANNKLRNTGVIVSAPSNELKSLGMNADGNVYVMPKKRIGYPMNFRIRRLKGFDKHDNPLWTFDSTFGLLPPPSYHDPAYSGNLFNLRAGEYTSNGGLIVFDANSYDSGFHLAVLKNNRFVWKASRGTFRNYSGEFPEDGSFDVGNSVAYPGNVAVSLDNNIIWGYHGEFWKNAQTNKFNHYNDDGLMIGQFGVTAWDPGVKGIKSAPGMAGNVFSLNLVKFGNDYYLYHNDEGQHSAVHRWIISNIASIKETISPLVLADVAVDPNTINLMGKLPWDAAFVNGTNGWVRTPEIDNMTSNASQWWQVRSGVKAYDKFSSPDIWARFTGPNNTEAGIQKDLGIINSDAWSLTGALNYDKNYTNWYPYDQTGGQYFDILDEKNKIIFRFEIKRDENKNMVILANNVVIALGSEEPMRYIIEKFQDFKLVRTAGGLKFKYADFDQKTIPVYDVAAHANAPKLIRFKFWTGKQILNRIVSFKDFVFTK